MSTKKKNDDLERDRLLALQRTESAWNLACNVAVETFTGLDYVKVGDARERRITAAKHIAGVDGFPVRYSIQDLKMLLEDAEASKRPATLKRLHAAKIIRLAIALADLTN